MKIRQIIGVLPLVVVVLSTVLHAQRVDTIRANPDGVQLRKIWQVTGGQFGGGRVGDGIGSVGDINGDGLDDWAVHEADAYAWKIYYGSRDGLSTTPVRVLQGLGGAYPVVGDFWGTGHKAVGFERIEIEYVNGNPFFHFNLPIYRTESNHLDSMPAVELSPRQMTPMTMLSVKEILAADLDNDGADELVLISRGVGRGSVLIGRYPEVWIFRGGTDFQVDTPTVILRDSENNGGNSGQNIVIGHADNDRRLDLIAGSPYADGVQKQKFYFSNPGSPWNWSQPDRVVPSGGWDLGDMAFLDCDGDGLLDIAVPGPPYMLSLFLSGSGKSLRTRPLTFETADRQYLGSTYITPCRVGFLNDSSRRYEMLGFNADGLRYLLGGGPNGPDGNYECYTGGLLGRIQLLGDLTGDGWDEVISSNSTLNFNSGYAAIYTGGPYIPRDPSLGVRHIATEEREDAISVWPNPVTTEVHVAWRGDLKRMPRRFRVHDMLGRLIAEGEVPSWRGEVRWTCEGQPAGVYILSILDYQGKSIATTQIVKA